MQEDWNNWVKENYQKVLAVSGMAFCFLWAVDILNTKYVNVRPNTDEELRAAVSNMPLVDTELKQILDKYGAERVVIFRVYSDYLDRDFGAEFPGSMTKTSIYSVTADHAVAASGISVSLPEVTHLPGSLLSPILDILINDPKTALSITTEELPHTALKELFEKRNTVESLWIAIPNSKTEFAGILQLDWSHTLEPSDKTKIAQELPECTRLLGRYL